MKQMNDQEFNNFLKESAKVAVKSSHGMGTYVAPAGADEIIKKKSTDDGLNDIIEKVTGGYSGDASKGSDPGKPKMPGEATKGADANVPSTYPEKGEGTPGKDPEGPSSTTKTYPMESEEEIFGENADFDVNESKILQKLIEEIDKTENSILDEMVSDEFDDSYDLDLDVDLLEMDDIDYTGLGDFDETDD